MAWDNEEEDDETPEWEVEDVKIPLSLEKRWKEEEKEGLRAGVCQCGYPFTKEDLSCRHCGTKIELSRGVFISLQRWLIHHPVGFVVLLIIVSSIIVYLVH